MSGVIEGPILAICPVCELCGNVPTPLDAPLCDRCEAALDGSPL